MQVRPQIPINGISRALLDLDLGKLGTVSNQTGYILGNEKKYLFALIIFHSKTILCPINLIEKVKNIQKLEHNDELKFALQNEIKSGNYTYVTSKDKMIQSLSENKTQFSLIKEHKIPQPQRNELLKEFIRFCVKELNLQSPLPKIKLTNDKSQTETYGHFSPSENEIIVYKGDRSFNDLGRTLCHELVHEQQRQNNKLNSKSGKDGSEQEDEANSTAGVIMRKWGRLKPETYE